MRIGWVAVEIGSISKQFAADAILPLVEDGKLRLDDPVSQYIAHAPAAWSAMTLRHVLTHTAGLPDFDTGNIGFSYRRDYSRSDRRARFRHVVHGVRGDAHFQEARPRVGALQKNGEVVPRSPRDACCVPRA